MIAAQWRRSRAGLVALAVAASGSAFVAACAPDLSSPTAAWRVSAAAYGPLRVGMTVAELNVAMGATLSPTAPIGRGCEQHGVPGGPGDMRLMLVDGVLVRIDVSDTTTQTRDGARVGSAEMALLRRFGARATVTAHRTRAPDWHTIAVPDSADPAMALVFETDGNRVVRYRAGRRPHVEWAGGCR